MGFFTSSSQLAAPKPAETAGSQQQGSTSAALVDTVSTTSLSATETSALTTFTTPDDIILSFEEGSHCPLVYNNTNHSLVVVLERAIFYRPQVLAPGQAASWTRRQTGGIVLSPYHVHVMIGDERAIPTAQDSKHHFFKTTAVPAAFCVGCMMTAASAGMLAGPSTALAPLVSGLVVKGMVVDSAVIAAGGLAANRAQAVAEMIVEKHPDKVMLKSPYFLPGKRFLVVTGGLGDGSLGLEQVPERRFKRDFMDVKKRSKCGRPPMLIKAPRPNLGQGDGMKTIATVEDDSSQNESLLTKILPIFGKGQAQQSAGKNAGGQLVERRDDK